MKVLVYYMHIVPVHGMASDQCAQKKKQLEAELGIGITSYIKVLVIPQNHLVDDHVEMLDLSVPYPSVISSPPSPSVNPYYTPNYYTFGAEGTTGGFGAEGTTTTTAATTY